MPQPPRTIRLTLAQALVRHLASQFMKSKACASASAVAASVSPAMAYVICLGEALHEFRKEDSSLARSERTIHGACRGGLCQAEAAPPLHVRNSLGWPGTTNMVTAAAVAHTNRPPSSFSA